MNWTIKKLAEACNGEIYAGDENIIINSFSIDTRTINDGDIYIGIKGESFDGNLFYLDAFEKGAKGVILNKSIKNKMNNNITKPIILVDDTIKALADLATAWLEEKKIPIVAVTGSVGKTSVKDMLHTIMLKKYNTYKPVKNFNNHIGLPFSILGITNHQAVVLEMGMNHLGEISYLSNIAKPDIAVITTVLPVHIEYLGSIENILKAKLEITEGLKPDGVLIINNDNEYLRNAKIDFPDIFRCAVDYECDLKAEVIETNKLIVKYQNKEIEFYHDNYTKGFIQNLLLSIAVGIKLGIPIDDINDAIKEFELSEGRLQNIYLKNNILLVNDAYNASAYSMKNSIDYLNKQECKRKIAIFGNMREVGKYSKALHSEVGHYINQDNLDYLITVGNDAKYIHDNASIKNKSHFNNKEELYPFLDKFIKPNDGIVAKAANGEKFIEIIDYFMKNMLQ